MDMEILGGCVASLSGLERSGFFFGRCSPVSGQSFTQRRHPLVSITRSTNGALPRNLVNDNLPSKNPKRTVDRLEYLFYPDRAVAEESIETPTGIPLLGRSIQNNRSCSQCESKGLVLCATCAGSGLYIDSILESQGIIVRVKCLGCGGSGSILCSSCGGRGHL